MAWRDQVVLVTGGARGIGRAAARRLAQHGAAVCINYAAHADKANELVRQITSAGGRAIAAAADVADAAAVAAMVSRTEKELGPLTILVNNAGVAWRGTLDDYDAEKVAAALRPHRQCQLDCSTRHRPARQRVLRGVPRLRS